MSDKYYVVAVHGNCEVTECDNLTELIAVVKKLRDYEIKVPTRQRVFMFNGTRLHITTDEPKSIVQGNEVYPLDASIAHHCDESGFLVNLLSTPIQPNAAHIANPEDSSGVSTQYGDSWDDTYDKDEDEPQLD